MDDTELAQTILALIENKKLSDAAELCYAELTNNPNNHVVRLHLARIFFEQGRLSFAARELAYINSKVPENPAVKKLLTKISPGGGFGETIDDNNGVEVVIAETEF